ncbi:unnamed protein product [Adineta steineri]|uniref:Carboxylesterase type B domain-containing protein n=1 Tax=Adineta steineri TaxID=433720 RepID=A0A813ULP0_9BILA|nr:unnamed protein product [Adineta steineri]
MSTCAIIYYCFHFWSYKRLSLLSNNLLSSNETEKSPTSNSTTLVIFDWVWFVAYCCYIGLFLYIPAHYIIAENYPIVTRIIILAEQVRFLMKSHAFVRENAPRAILYGQIYSQEINADDLNKDKSNDSSNEQSTFSVPHTPCPEFSKFLYFLFAPTLIYRDSYPRTSSIRWTYVISQLVQFATTSLFADATNAILLAMSKHSDGIIARVIAQSGCPFHQWSVDRQPIVRFNNVLKQNNMNSKKKFLHSNIEQLKTMAAKDFQYTYQYGLDKSSDYPFPVVDNDLVIDNFEQLIHTGSLVNTDILIGVTADESLYLAEEHIFYNYLPKQNRKNSSIVTNSRSSAKSITEYEQIHGFSYFKKKKFIKNFLKKYHPEYLCFYEEIEAQYMPKIKRERSLTEIAHLYTNLVSDLMIYYDLIRFLRERLQSQSKASTYVYYYTNPAIFNLNNLLQRIPNMVGHFAELDLIWGVPFFNRSNLSYTSDETELSRQMIRYWTNFAKTGNPNEPNSVSVQWPPYEKIKKSYINFHAKKLLVEDNFLEARFQFWNIIAHRQLCIPFYWYHTSLLVGILILTIFLILIYIFFNSKRSRRNIKPTELTTTNIITTYHFLPSVVS